MYVFDSDHLSLLQRQTGDDYSNLAARCRARPAMDFFVTVISLHEQFNGWTRYIARAKDSAAMVRGYGKLEGVVSSFAHAQVLPFSSAAADVFDDLTNQRVRIGSMDRRIASIAIANQMTLLTRNTVDFERVPGLTFEDWTLPIKD